MSWFNINLGEITSSVRALMPRQCVSPGGRTTTVKNVDTFKLQVPIKAESTPVQKLPPVRTNLQKLEVPARKREAEVRAETSALRAEREVNLSAHKAQQDAMSSAVWKAAENNDHRAFFTLIQKKPALLNQTDELGRTPLDLMPESRRKTELYERVKPLLNRNVFVDAAAEQPKVRYVKDDYPKT